jgi:hypothetical protein
MCLKKGKYIYLGIFSLLGLLLILSCSSGSAPSPSNNPPQEITVSLPNTNPVSFLVTDQGRLVKKTQFTSSDGMICLSIDAGATLLGVNNTLLQSKKVFVDSIIPVPPKNAGKSDLLLMYSLKMGLLTLTQVNA